MSKGCPRLWKKIGSQSHHPLEFSSHPSIQSENHRFIQKQEIQQICLPTEESIIRDRENELSLDQCCKDCITQLALLGANEPLEGNKQQQRKNEKIVGVCRCNVKGKYIEQISLDKDMERDKITNRLKGQKLKKVLLGLKSAISDLKNQNRQLEIEIGVQKSKALEQVQQILSILHRTMNEQMQRIKQTRQALTQLQKNSETKYKQIQVKMQIRQKQLQNKIAQLDIKLINQRYEEQKLKKQFQIIKAQRDRLFRDNGDLYEKIFDLQQQVLGIDLEVQKRVGEILKVTVGRYVASDKNQGSAKGVQQFTPSKQEHLDIYGYNLHDTHKTTTQKNHLPRLSIKTDDRPSTNSVLKNPSSLRSLFSPCNREKKYCSPVKPSRIVSPSNSMTLSLSQTQKKTQAQDRSWKQTHSNSIQSSKFIKKEILGSQKRIPNINDISSKIHTIRYQIENEIKNMRSTSKSFNQ